MAVEILGGGALYKAFKELDIDATRTYKGKALPLYVLVASMSSSLNALYSAPPPRISTAITYSSTYSTIGPVL